MFNLKSTVNPFVESNPGDKMSAATLKGYTNIFREIKKHFGTVEAKGKSGISVLVVHIPSIIEVNTSHRERDV
jgi:hypothetical protein